MTASLRVGHVIDDLRKLPPHSIHMAVTSVPYWGLRAYGTEPQVWGGDPKCRHRWGDKLPGDGRRGQRGHSSQFANRGVNEPQVAGRQHDRGSWCQKCKAWRGEHGLEPTMKHWLRHEVAIFREVKRVLRPDGTLWLNVGDAYATDANGRSAAKTKELGDDDRTFRDKPFSTANELKAKQRLMLPARLALALQHAGWWLRDEIVWHKLNPMPSSVTDRTCPAHEMFYMFSPRAHYFYDHVAILEAFADQREGRDYKMPDNWDTTQGAGSHGTILCTGRNKGRPASERNRGGRTDGFTKPNDIDPSGNGGKIKRSVWPIATEPFPEAHFATFPTALITPPILAGTSAKGCCPTCGAQWERITRKVFQQQPDAPNSALRAEGQTLGDPAFNRREGSTRGANEHTTLGFYPTCKCYAGVPRLPAYPPHPKRGDMTEPMWKATVEAYRGRCAVIDEDRRLLCDSVAGDKTKPCTVLDPFAGSGTTGLVCEDLGRDSILIELNPDYAKIARRRIRRGMGRVTTDLVEETPRDLPLFAAE